MGIDRRLNAVVLGTVFALSATVSSAIGQSIYRNVSGLFGNESYGTLALNVGALNSARNLRQFAYQVLDRGGETAIPRQNSYCFVVVHYGGHPPGDKHTYTFRRYEENSAGEIRELGDHSSTFDIASGVSSNMPSYCFPWRGEDSFILEVSSSDGVWFDHVYRIRVR